MEKVQEKVKEKEKEIAERVKEICALHGSGALAEPSCEDADPDLVMLIAD